MSAMSAPSRSFICLRHGATDWNRQGLFQGRTDNPLNDDGIAQAHAAAEKLRAIALRHVVSSPLLRAVQTAEIIANIASRSVVLDHGLIELDFGSFEGQPVRELMKRHVVGDAVAGVELLIVSEAIMLRILGGRARAEQNCRCSQRAKKPRLVSHAVQQVGLSRADRQGRRQALGGVLISERCPLSGVEHTRLLYDGRK